MDACIARVEQRHFQILCSSGMHIAIGSVAIPDVMMPGQLSTHSHVCSWHVLRVLQILHTIAADLLELNIGIGGQLAVRLGIAEPIFVTKGRAQQQASGATAILWRHAWCWHGVNIQRLLDTSASDHGVRPLP